jgi:hypothetical protein
MTIKESGQLAISELLVETRSERPNGLGWLKSITKQEQRLPDGSVPMSLFYNRAYYQRLMDGNCNNGNCGSPVANINCLDCDKQLWLQTNCNSNPLPVYNCEACQGGGGGGGCGFDIVPVVVAVATIAIL